MSTKRLSSAAALLGAAVGAFLPFSSVPARPGHEPAPLTSVLDRPDAERSRAGHTASAPSITNSDAALLELPSEPARPDPSDHGPPTT